MPVSDFHPRLLAWILPGLSHTENMLKPYSIPTAAPSGLPLPQHLANSQAWHLPVESLCSTLRANFQQVPTARHLSVFSAINESHVCPPIRCASQARVVVWGRCSLSSLSQPSELWLSSYLHIGNFLTPYTKLPMTRSSVNHSLNSALCFQRLCGFCLLTGP